MSEYQEPPQVGLSSAAHAKLSRLKDEGHFNEMSDAYRCSVALALAHGAIAGKDTKSNKTTFSVSTLDRDRTLFAITKALRLDEDEAVYRTVERLAEWGVNELSEIADKGEIQFSDLLRNTRQK
ncbi:protein of unknown function [uncultured Woeseiaceae bacterium]|uniref:Uncharacterized protein n=1 Tax=uncultured Woeseiaceae bacterium TaxID=1983305 RepID=A0A7D9D2B5_9GAMM|nr:protein of unknown function [uncultured Woeseiaceae bacterium]